MNVLRFSILMNDNLYNYQFKKKNICFFSFRRNYIHVKIKMSILLYIIVYYVTKNVTLVIFLDF